MNVPEKHVQCHIYPSHTCTIFQWLWQSREHRDFFSFNISTGRISVGTYIWRLWRMGLQQPYLATSLHSWQARGATSNVASKLRPRNEWLVPKWHRMVPNGTLQLMLEHTSRHESLHTYMLTNSINCIGVKSHKIKVVASETCQSWIQGNDSSSVVCISKYLHKVWGAIIYLFSNFNCTATES